MRQSKGGTALIEYQVRLSAFTAVGRQPGAVVWKGHHEFFGRAISDQPHVRPSTITWQLPRASRRRPVMTLGQACGGRDRPWGEAGSTSSLSLSLGGGGRAGRPVRSECQPWQQPFDMLEGASEACTHYSVDSTACTGVFDSRNKRRPKSPHATVEKLARNNGSLAAPTRESRLSVERSSLLICAVRCNPCLNESVQECWRVPAC